MCTSPEATDRSAARKLLRAEMKQKRLALPPEKQEEAARTAAERLFSHPAWRDCRSLALYSPIRGELSPRFVWEQAKKEGKLLLFPRCRGKQMDFFPVEDPERMPQGAFGIPEPEGTVPREDFSRTLVLTPALAVDENFFRLGWGGGFYDRFFAEHPVMAKLGFVFGFQRVKTVYPQNWDIPLDGVTPS